MNMEEFCFFFEDTNLLVHDFVLISCTHIAHNLTSFLLDLEIALGFHSECVKTDLNRAGI